MRVFVSSERYPANLGGLDGADAKCQALADAAGMDGVFKAWLSDVDVSAGERLVHHDVPYVRLDGTKVADGWDELVVPVLDARIAVDELGQQPPYYDSVPSQLDLEVPLAWTGTWWDGTSAQKDSYCGGPDWASDKPQGNSIAGSVLDANVNPGNPAGAPLPQSWSGALQSPTPCTIEHHLYCLEQ